MLSPRLPRSWTFLRSARRILDGRSPAPSAAAELRVDDPTFSARHFPLHPASARFIERATLTPTGADGFPVPPRELWAGYGTTPDEYVASGRHHVDAMLAQLGAHGFQPRAEHRLLEFGCAAGRMTRAIANLDPRPQLVGVDIAAAGVRWCQDHLTPPFDFAATSTFPHLPFEDRGFDLIFACSIFTHIVELQDAWILELRRLLKPGGLAYVTIHDEATLRILRDAGPGHWLHDTPLRRDVLAFFAEHGDEPFEFGVLSRAFGNAQLFHSRRYVERVWGRWLQLEEAVESGYGYQTALILRRPADG